jgi:hypothetical protein
MKLLQNLLVCDLALLEVLMHNQSAFITHSAFASRDQGIADVIRLANITIDALPTFITLASVTLPWWAVLPSNQRPTQGVSTVFAAPSWRTSASAVGCCAVGKLVATEIVEITVEAGRTVRRPLIVEDLEGRIGERRPVERCIACNSSSGASCYGNGEDITAEHCRMDKRQIQVK